MAVYRNRSTTSVPAPLSISYLIGSPPIGTSTMTLTSRGGSMPIEIASIRMDCSAILSDQCRDLEDTGSPGKASGPFGGLDSVGPGEGNLVQRLGAELLGGSRNHAAAEGAIKLCRGIVVGKRPDHHAFQAAVQKIAPCRGKQPSSEPEALEFRPQIKLVDLAFEMQAARAIAAVIGIARNFVAEHQHADAATFADPAVPPLRATAVDQFLQFATGNDALIRRTPGLVMGGRHRHRIRSFGRPNFD